MFNGIHLSADYIFNSNHARAPGKREYLMIIRDNFSYFSLKIYIVTPHRIALSGSDEESQYMYFCADPQLSSDTPYLELCMHQNIGKIHTLSWTGHLKFVLMAILWGGPVAQWVTCIGLLSQQSWVWVPPEAAFFLSINGPSF